MTCKNRRSTGSCRGWVGASDVGVASCRPASPGAVGVGMAHHGGTGGAIALAAANKVLMLEHSIYTVASPEASASILWRSSEKAELAATAMKITSKDLQRLGIIDEIIEEPIGGAHRERPQAIMQTKLAIMKSLDGLMSLTSDDLRKHRREKFLKIGRNL